MSSIIGKDDSVFNELFEIEDRHFWFIGRNRIILSALKRNIPCLSEVRMLEIGCGNGNVMAYLMQNGVHIEGGDLSVEGLRNCRRRLGDVPLYQIDILSLPFHNEFDVIGAFDVLEHVDDDEKALAQIGQALKPRGSVILTVPMYKFMWSSFDEYGGHKRRYSKGELIAKLEHNNFMVKNTSFFMFFLFPLLALMRIIRGYSVSIDLKVIPVVNNIFLGLLYLESELMKYMNFPFGASLLVVAEKNDES